VRGRSHGALDVLILSVWARILGSVSAGVRLPAWVVPDADAVQECERVACRLIEHQPYGATRRDAGVASALVWFTLGEVSPMTGRCCPTSAELDDLGIEPMSGVTWDVARAESWVALSVAAGQAAPAADDWCRLGVEPAPACVDDPEFAYGVWRALAWLLGVRDDFPVHTAWHRAAGIPPERPHLYARRRRGDPDEAWWTAERAARERAHAEAQRWWRHVRARLDAPTVEHAT